MAKTVNTFEKGLVILNNKTKQPEHTYSYALNAVPNDEIIDRSSLTREQGFDDYIKLREDDYTILGSEWLGDEQYVFFIKNVGSTGVPFNQIWYVDIKEGIKELKYDSIDLNFRDNNPIISTYRINYKNEILVYFVDGLNDDRLINISQPNTLDLDISMLSMNSSEVKPSITVESIDSGGIIKSGQYFVAVAYKDINDFQTGTSEFSLPISISDSPYQISNSRQYINTIGSQPDSATTKKLVINIKDIDPRYNRAIIYTVQITDTETKIFKSNDLTIQGNQLRHEFTGFNDIEDTTIDLNDLIVSRVNYYASHIINQRDNRLIRGNSKIKESLINYQEYANNIKVQYSVEEVIASNYNMRYNFIEGANIPANEGIPTLSRKASSIDYYAISPEYLSKTGNSLEITSKTFMRDEVYALGVSFELNDGTETDVFHIPGRTPNNMVSTLSGVGEFNKNYGGQSDWDDGNAPSPVSNMKRWQVYNTAIKRSNRGELAYWRSSEEYPKGYGFPEDGEKSESGNSYVRHHKMPSDVLEPITRTQIVNSDSKTKEYITYKRYIKLYVSNIEIPDDIKHIVTKIKFHYVKRDYTNKSIISKGLLFNTFRTSGFNGVRQAPQFNQFSGEKHDTVQFYSPDVDFMHKQFPIGANAFKSGYVAKGYINYIGRRGYNVGGSLNNTGTYYVNLANNYLADINPEGTPYNQLLVGSVFYNETVPAVEHGYYSKVYGAAFTDPNSRGVIPGVVSADNAYGFMGESKGVILNLFGLDNPDLRIINSMYPGLNLDNPSKSSNVHNQFNYTGSLTGLHSVVTLSEVYYDTVRYGSLIRDLPNQYDGILNLVYTSLGTSIPVTSSNIYSTEIKNGDSYIEVHYTKKGYSVLNTVNNYSAARVLEDEQRTGAAHTIATPIAEYKANSYIAYFVETDINIRMRNKDPNKPQDQPDYWPILNTGNKDYLYEYEKKSVSDEYFNVYPFYNTTHIKEYYANDKSLSELGTVLEDIRYSTRLIYSDKQDYEDKTDHYRISRANNYKDLPMNRGQITQSFSKDDKLFVLTRDALFNVYTSNSTIQSTSGDNIVLGTGEFFSMEPVELLSIKGGFGGTSSKLSLVESQFGFLYVDTLKNKVILFNDNLADINILGLNEDFKLYLYDYIKELKNIDGFDNPVTGPGISSTFDPVLNRFIITKKDYIPLDSFLDDYKGTYDPTKVYKVGDFVERGGSLYEITSLDPFFVFNRVDFNDGCLFENKSFTVSFDPIRQVWISYHSYIPDYYIPHNTEFLKIEDSNTIVKYNSKNFENCYPFIIETVFNEYPLVTKVFDSLTVNCETSIDGNSTNEFFDKVYAYNENQSTGYIGLDEFNLVKREKDWNLNKLLDISMESDNKKLFSEDWEDIKCDFPVDKVLNLDEIDTAKPWYLRGRMKDKYLVVRFIYSNNLQNSKIIVNFVSSTYRVSQR